MDVVLLIPDTNAQKHCYLCVIFFFFFFKYKTGVRTVTNTKLEITVQLKGVLQMGDLWEVLLL